LLFGTTSNRDFLISVLQRDTFANGLATTAFINEEFSKSDLETAKPGFFEYAIAAVLQYHHERQCAFSSAVNVSPALLNWSSNNAITSSYTYDDRPVQVSPQSVNAYQVHCVDQVSDIELLEIAGVSAKIKIAGVQQQLFFMVPEAGVLHLSIDGKTMLLRNQLAFSAQAGDSVADGKVLAPMHGVVQDVFVSAGDKVKKGHRLAVVEAMKMQHEIHASIDGVVKDVVATQGKQVAASELLMEIA
jgi:geranyl-CoA carboxylase alpha subunit